MRTFILVCVVAIAVAVGISHAVGLITVTADHVDEKYVVSLTVDTAMLHRSASSHGTDLRVDAAHDELQQIQGTIAAVRLEKNEFSLADNVKNWTFQLAKSGSVTINGRESNLSQLRLGDEATVDFDRAGQDLIATAVHCTRR